MHTSPPSTHTPRRWQSRRGCAHQPQPMPMLGCCRRHGPLGVEWFASFAWQRDVFEFFRAAASVGKFVRRVVVYVLQTLTHRWYIRAGCVRACVCVPTSVYIRGNALAPRCRGSGLKSVRVHDFGAFILLGAKFHSRLRSAGASQEHHQRAHSHTYTHTQHADNFYSICA